MQPIEVQPGPQTSDKQNALATSGTAQGLFGETFGDVFGAALPTVSPKSTEVPVTLAANIAIASHSSKATEGRNTQIDLGSTGAKLFRSIVDRTAPIMQPTVGSASSAKDAGPAASTNSDSHSTMVKAGPETTGIISDKPLWTGPNTTTPIAKSTMVKVIAGSSAKLKSVAGNTSPVTAKTDIQQTSIAHEATAKAASLDVGNSNDHRYSIASSPAANIPVTVSGDGDVSAADPKPALDGANSRLSGTASSKMAPQQTTAPVPLSSTQPKITPSSTPNVHTNNKSIQVNPSQALPWSRPSSTNVTVLSESSPPPQERAISGTDEVIFITEKLDLKTRASIASTQIAPSKKSVQFDAGTAANSAVTKKTDNLNADPNAVGESVASTNTSPQTSLSTKPDATGPQSTSFSHLVTDEDSLGPQTSQVPSVLGAVATKNHGVDGATLWPSDTARISDKATHISAGKTGQTFLSADTKYAMPTSPLPGTTVRTSSQVAPDQVLPTPAPKTRGSADRSLVTGTSFASANSDSSPALRPLVTVDDTSPQRAATKPVAARSIAAVPSETSPAPATTQVDQATTHPISVVPTTAPTNVTNGISQTVITPTVQLVPPSPLHQATPATASSSSNLLGAVTSSPRTSLSDSLVSSEPHKTFVATPTTLEVGLPNGTQGWLKIRAEVGNEGNVNASLSAATSAGQQSLHRQLPALNAYLHSEQVAVTTSIADRVFAPSNPSLGAGTTGSNNANGSDASGRPQTQGAVAQDAGAQQTGTGSGPQRDARDSYATSVPEAVPNVFVRSYQSTADLHAVTASQASRNDVNGHWLNVRA